MRRAFTLIELLVVIVITGILASLAVPQFTKTKERALDNEAKANLILIKAAQKMYNFENDAYLYLTPTSPADINANLKLSLPVATDPWKYEFATQQTAKATKAGGTRVWTIDYTNDNDPSCSGTTGCP